MSSNGNIEAPRIGNGTSELILGGVAFAFAVFAGMAAAGGSSGAGAVALLALAAAAAFFAAAFWKRLASRIELRLMDIERATRAR